MTQTSPSGFIRTEEQAILDTEALKLRSNGLTYQKVADYLGVSKSTAFERVQRALASIPREAVEEYRKLENERLDLLLEKVLDTALATNENKGYLFAVDRALAIFERKGKLNGTDAPVKTVNITVDALDMEIIKLSAELGVDGRELESRILSEISNSFNAETDAAGEAS